MKVLLVATLALLPLAAIAPVGHAPAPRQSAHEFGLELTALGLGAAGRLDASAENCVVVQAHGPAAVIAGRATLTRAEGLGPGRLELEAAAPDATERLTGGLPLTMELRPFTLPTRNDIATIGVHLGEGSVGAAAGARVTLSLWVEHEGAPIGFAVGAC